MRARTWVRDVRLGEALELKKHIAALERELIAETSGSVGMLKLAELGQQLRRHKFRLEVLERCISGLSERARPAEMAVDARKGARDPGVRGSSAC